MLSASLNKTFLPSLPDLILTAQLQHHYDRCYRVRQLVFLASIIYVDVTHIASTSNRVLDSLAIPFDPVVSVLFNCVDIRLGTNMLQTCSALV